MKRRKGVSPVIATLLLIVIAVAAAVVTYSWVMGFIGTTTTAPAQTQARIVVEAVKTSTHNSTHFKITQVYIRNTGAVSITPSAVYVYFANGTIANSTVGYTGILTTSSISSGGVSNIIATNQYILVPVDSSYYVKVVTQEGAVATSETFSPP